MRRMRQTLHSSTKGEVQLRAMAQLAHCCCAEAGPYPPELAVCCCAEQVEQGPVGTHCMRCPGVGWQSGGESLGQCASASPCSAGGIRKLGMWGPAGLCWP